ncbi:MAG: EamA family transporter [Acidobacteriota bacterium]
MPNPPSRFVVTATLALLIVIWGTTWSVIKISLGGIPPLTGVAIRFAIASVLLGAIALARGKSLGSWKSLPIWLVQALLSFSVTYGLVYWAQQWVPSGLTSLLYSTMPLFVVLFGYVVLPEERLGPLALVGVAAGFAGVAVIFSDDVGALALPEVRWAAGWVLVAPIGGAIAQVVVKRWGQDLSAFALTAPPMAITALVIGAFAWRLEQDRAIVWATAPVLATLYLAVLGSALNFSLYFWLLKYLSATQLSLIAYAVPVVAVTVGTLVLDEPLTLRMLAGGALVVAGVAFAVRPRRTAPA